MLPKMLLKVALKMISKVSLKVAPKVALKKKTLMLGLNVRYDRILK